MNKRRISLLIIKLIVIILINIFLIKIVGYKYLKRLNTFIKENNNVTIKNAINKIIYSNDIDINDNLYKIVYNDKKEIINLDLNINNINILLSKYVDTLNNVLENDTFSFLDKYYETIKTKNNIYYLLPLGMVSDNPFIYNIGPKIVIGYEFINTPTLKMKVNIKNYGLNNALVETYLDINIKQSVLKPILSEISNYKYSYLISSKIINGRVSNYLGTSISKESEYTNND